MEQMIVETVQGEYIPLGQGEESTAWGRLPDEPTLWYDRFDLYRSLGPHRSILGAYRLELEWQGNSREELGSLNTAPAIWYTTAKEYNWESRATQWDDQQRALRYQDEEKLREEIRQDSIDALRLTLDKVTRGIAVKDEESIASESIAALSNSQKNSIGQLDKLLNGTSPTTQVNVLVADLSPELRLALAETVKKHST